MRKPIIAGNWKMYKTLHEAIEFVNEIKDKIPNENKWKQLFVHQHCF